MTAPYEDVLDRDGLGLLLVDVQKAFASRESPLVDRGVDLGTAVETVPNVRELLAAARRHGVPAFFTRSVRRRDGRDAPARHYDVRPDVYRDGEPICCAGAEETEYVDGIEPREEEYEVRKYRYDAFVGTRLETYLRLEGVETVVVAGFTTNVCVDSTARGAHERGFDVLVVEDCCATFDERQHEATLENVRLALGDTVTLSEATALFDSGADG